MWEGGQLEIDEKRPGFGQERCVREAVQLRSSYLA